MGVDDIINEKHGNTLADAQRQQQQRQQQQQQRQAMTDGGQPGGVSVNLGGGTISFDEKTDIEFWLNVAQTALLAYIAWKL